MEFSERILDYLSRNNIQPAKVAKATGIDKSTFSKWKVKPTSKLDLDILVKIANYLDVSTDCLLTGKEKSPSAEQTIKEQLTPDERELVELYKSLSEKDKTRVTERARALYDLANEQVKKPELVPLYYVENRVSAGTGASLSDYEQGATVYVPATPESRRADFVLKISGDSMEPKFYDGDYVLVRSQAVVEVGQIGIFGNNGDGFIKKLGKRDLISLNSKYKPIPITEETTCFGLVLGITEIVSK